MAVVQNAAFVHPLIPPVGVILGQHQLLPGFIPVRQFEGLVFGSAQQPLNGGCQFGLGGVLVLLFQAMRDGTGLIGGKPSDQAHQNQQPGDEGERDMLD